MGKGEGNPSRSKNQGDYFGVLLTNPKVFGMERENSTTDIVIIIRQLTKTLKITLQTASDQTSYMKTHTHTCA